MTEITGLQLPETFEWLFATLSGDATLAGLVPGGWHEHPAPQGATTPYGTFQTQSDPEDLMVVGSHRVWEDTVFLVRVIAEGRSTMALKPAVNRLDALLHRAAGTTDGGRVISCVREGGFHSSDVAQGKSYRHLGGFYRVLAQPLSV